MDKEDMTLSVIARSPALAGRRGNLFLMIRLLRLLLQ